MEPLCMGCNALPLSVLSGESGSGGYPTSLEAYSHPPKYNLRALS